MSSEQKSCLGFMGFLFGHNYEPRYNLAVLESKEHHPPPNPSEIGALLNNVTFDEETAMDTLEKMHLKGNDTSEKTYVCDICARCGHVVKP